MNNILINALGIQSSGGITVLEKFFDEIKAVEDKKFFVVCFDNENINRLIEVYDSFSHFNFLAMENKGFIHRLFYENFTFKKIIAKYKIDLIYNFSGTTQYFIGTSQLLKIHNLLFYSKKTDTAYFKNKKFKQWIKQIFLRRIVFKSMLNKVENVEIQSSHVKNYLSEFINTTNKKFYIKSDIDVESSTFQAAKKYDFSKKIKFLYIIGGSFDNVHKNFSQFVNTMLILKNKGLDIEINITISKDKLENSTLWDNSLNSITNFLGYISKTQIESLFCDNTILMSTSIIETLGLPVIEATKNGIISIVPNEPYSKTVYGEKMPFFELFDTNSSVSTLNELFLLDNNVITDIISSNQQYLVDTENKKYKNIIDVFDKILKGENV